MRVEFMLNGKAGYGIVRVTGPVTRAEYEPGIEALLAHPEFQAGMAIIYDLRAADLGGLRAEDFRHFARVNGRLAGRRGVARSALVVDSTLQFGLMRMYETLAATDNLRNQLFRDLDDAIAWAQAVSG